MRGPRPGRRGRSPFLPRPGFAPAPPALGWRVLLAGQPARRLIEGDLPLNPCPKVEPGPLPPRCPPGCRRGRRETWGPRVQTRVKGGRPRGPPLPPAPGAPWPQRWALGFLSAEAEHRRGGGGGCSRPHSGPCLVGPGVGKWPRRGRIGVQVSVSGALSERAPPDGSPCLHVSAFSSSRHSVARLSALESCRLRGTPGPASPPLRRGTFPSPGPRRSLAPSAPALRAQACAGSRTRAPGAVASERVLRPSEPPPPQGPAVSPGPAPARPIPPPPPPSRLGLGCKVQPRRKGEGLGSRLTSERLTTVSERVRQVGPGAGRRETP